MHLFFYFNMLFCVTACFHEHWCKLFLFAERAPSDSSVPSLLCVGVAAALRHRRARRQPQRWCARARVVSPLAIAFYMP